MSKKSNAYVNAIDARIAHEKQKATACAATMKMLRSAREFCERENVAAFLTDAKVDASFFNSNVNASDKTCVKAIDRAMSYLAYAAFDAAFLRTENARTVLATAINLHRAKMQMTRSDAQAACTAKNDKRVEIDKAKLKHIVQRATIIDASKRQSSMSLIALQCLNVIKQVSRDAFELNADSKIAQAMLAKAS